MNGAVLQVADEALAARAERELAVDPAEAALVQLAAAPDAIGTEAPLRLLAGALRGGDRARVALTRERAIAAIKLNGKIGAPVQIVDAFLGTPSCEGLDSTRGRALDPQDPEPWPEPVEGSPLLGELAEVITRFVALPSHAAIAIVLWVLHAHALEAAIISPMLALISPEKRCGKTTALTLIRWLVPRPLLSSNISLAAIFRVIEKCSPTLLIDEADTFLAAKEELRGILNSGHTREAAYVVRAVGEDYEPRRFSTWSAKVVALIGRLPDTLADRSIIIPMRRRAPEETVERLRLDQPRAFVTLHRRAARWAADHADTLRSANPEVPGELGDRAADNWRPLLAIADLVGGKWPQQARQAALALSGKADPHDGAREQLLGDIHAFFAERGVQRVFTDDLLQDLCAREDRPWSEWKNGKPLTPPQLSRLLYPFGVKPGTQRNGAETRKGYALEGFRDAFARYLSPDPSQPSQASADNILRDSSSRHALGPVTDREAHVKSCQIRLVTGVTDQDPGSGWGEV